MEIQKTCCLTGCRPDRLPFRTDESHPDCVKLKNLLRRELERLIREEGVTRFITSLDVGADFIGAELVLELKKKYPRVILESVIPYEEQAARWSASQRERYYEIARKCDESVQLQTAYTHLCKRKRSRYMVSRGGYLLAVWGGDARTECGWLVLYARDSGRNLTIIDPVKLKITRENQTSAARE